MKAVHLHIRQVGNSQGVVIPKPILAQLGLSSDTGVDISVEGGAPVLRKPADGPRKGWAEAAMKVAAGGDDTLVMGEFANEMDEDLTW